MIGICRRRKRQTEFIELLAKIDRLTPSRITLIHCICDNVSVHHGKKVRAWLEENFADLNELESKITAFIDEWNQEAHPFKWTEKSFKKVIQKFDREIPAAA